MADIEILTDTGIETVSVRDLKNGKTPSPVQYPHLLARVYMGMLSKGLQVVRVDAIERRRGRVVVDVVCEDLLEG